MKIRQTAKHVAFRRALELPVVGGRIHDRLVDLHVDVFGEWAAAGRREEREPHLEGFFDGAVDMYLAALQAGYSEAEAREMTHVVGNADFYNHGWTEMLEFPPDELDEHFDRYASFFDRHGIAPDDPLGEFVPEEGVPSAPPTPERLEDGDLPHADPGYADDVYVEDDEGAVHEGGTPETTDGADQESFGSS